MIRGFATNRLLYSVDGVRMNNAIFRGGNIQNVINLDPFATENTEVVFGPGSVIYGSDAVGGVMSFRTLTPQFSTDESLLVTGKLVGRFSTANQEKTGHLDLNVGGNKWSGITSISYWDYDHLRQGRHGPDDYIKDYYVESRNGEDVILTQDDPQLQIPSGYNQLNVMQKLRYKPNSKWDMQYAFHFSETSSYGRYDRHNRRLDDQPRYAVWDYGPQKWMMNFLEIDFHEDHKLWDELSVRLAHQLFGESRMERTINETNQTTTTEKVIAYSLNLDAFKSLAKRHTLFYGFEYILNNIQSTGEIKNIKSQITEIGPSRYPMADWTSIGAYITDEFTISEFLTLSGGIRYNHFELAADFSENGRFYSFPFSEANLGSGALTGSMGSVYRLSERVIISANFGSAFRAPNVDDMGKVFDSEPGAVTVPNADLKAEYACNMDLGIATFLSDNIRLDATAYYTNLQNALVRRNFRLNGQDSIIYDGQLSQVQAIQNAAVANVYGLQLGIETNITKGITLSSDLNIQRGEEELDDGSVSPSRHAAPLFGATRLNYRSNKITLQAYAMYQGERSADKLSIDERRKDEIYAQDENGNNYAPAWYTLNLKGSFELSKKVVLSMGLENITDQRYRPYSSGLSGAGRNLYLSGSINF